MSTIYVEDLDLPVGAYLALKRAGIYTADQVPTTEYQLMSIPRMRQSDACAILEALNVLRGISAGSRGIK